MFVEVGVGLYEFDVVVVMSGLGFVGVLMVGVGVVKGFVVLFDKLLYVVNYLVGYIVVDIFIVDFVFLEYLIIVLFVFGGYILLLYVCDFIIDVELFGEMMDDVVGEVFDKVVWLLLFFYFGGLEIDCVVVDGDFDVICFFWGLFCVFDLVVYCYDFFFLGLKMVVVWWVECCEVDGVEVLFVDVVVSFCEVVVDVFVMKVFVVCVDFGVFWLFFGGGVIVNWWLWEVVFLWVEVVGVIVCIFLLLLCIDNGVMIVVFVVEFIFFGWYLLMFVFGVDLIFFVIEI